MNAFLNINSQTSTVFLQQLIRTQIFLLLVLIVCPFFTQTTLAQTPPAPTILEVTEDDRAAVIYWNSKKNTYSPNYDPDKQQDIYSYLIEWGTVAGGFTNKDITPYRAYQPQPLTPNTVYQARVYALNSVGQKSAASNVIQFQHSDTKVNDMRNRLNGFFDDFNLPMGGFDETKWNQAYSGCMKPGAVSQHINNQFHAHNVSASDRCDRGVASSRPRQIFDFRNRTGVIEFDMDGAKLFRQRWYLDFTPANRKNDITGHISIDDGSNPPVGDPGYLLRLTEVGHSVIVQLADQYGALHSLQNVYRNGACGYDMQWCNSENLIPIPNVRKHWRIELSKTDVRIFIEGTLVLDASLVTNHTPNGLPFEEAQLNWIFFSYNTPKENLPLSMVHWDNFGFDAPAGWMDNTVVHNYTDGKLGTETVSNENDPAAGALALSNTPAIAQIPIPDSTVDHLGNAPLTTELMFTIQGGNYNWVPSDNVTVNGHTYSFAKPISNIPGFPDNQLVGTLQPYSAIINIDPTHLITGNNEVRFYLNHARVLNIHIELLFPKNQAPTFSQPGAIFPNHMQKLMEFNNHNDFGPGLTMSEIDGYQIWTSEFQKVSTPYGVEKVIKQTPVSGIIDIDILANSNAQLAASAHATGIEYFEVLIDSQVVDKIDVNADEPVAAFRYLYQLNTNCLSNGIHELFIIAYDSDGFGSAFDLFESGVKSEQYLPVEITVANNTTQPQLDVQVMLEGAYTGSATMTTALNAKQLIPNLQPFNRQPWNYSGAEAFTNLRGDIVDWVLVSLRTGMDRSTEVNRFAALLRNDGQLVDVAGCPPALGVNAGSYYIAIYHSNHLNVLSPNAVSMVNDQLQYDFRSANSYVAGSGQKEVTAGVWAMYSGNGDQANLLSSKDINGQDQALWNPNNGLFNLYSEWDYNLDGDINGLDKLFWSYNNGVFTNVD